MRLRSTCVAMALLLLLGQARLFGGETPRSPPASRVIPRPVSIECADGVYRWTEKTAIHVGSDESANIGRYLAKLMTPATGYQPAVKSAGASESGGIALKLDAARKDLGDEGYVLVSTAQGVTITAAQPAGLFYGAQTLRQLLPIEVESRQKVEGVEWTVPCVSIVDRPRFKWRGYLLDPARNFRTKEELKRYIDLLALQKMNVLQIHLTDDQGWRVEIKKYPKLVEVGARLPDFGGRKGEGWFYSQAEIKELVAYAASRYVTVVPEIEMPGHSGAAIASYPDLACENRPPQGWSAPLCVSKEATLEFATGVLDEVTSLFPSPYIHIGADEVPPERWRACPKCKAAMERLAKEKLPEDVVPFRVKVVTGAGVPFHEDIGRLQGEFVRKIDRHLTARGRRMVGWDEILEGGLKTGSPAMVMAWRSPAAIAGAVSCKRDVIVTLYPDYYLDNGTSLGRTYALEPAANLSPEQEKYVIGVQGNMWGEHTQTIQRVDAQSLPRLCALAESGWTSREHRDYRGFQDRLSLFCKRLDLMGVNYRKPIQ